MASAIANAYFRRIEAGKITLQDVLDNPRIENKIKTEVTELVATKS